MRKSPDSPALGARVALYLRALPDDPGSSLSSQVALLQGYAVRHGLSVERVYIDITGSRSQFDAMVSEAIREDSRFQAILVHDADRLSGLLDGQPGLLTRLGRKGVEVIYTGQSIAQ